MVTPAKNELLGGKMLTHEIYKYLRMYVYLETRDEQTFTIKTKASKTKDYLNLENTKQNMTF